MTGRYIPRGQRAAIWRTINDLTKPLALYELVEMIEPDNPRKNLCGISKMVRGFGCEVELINGIAHVMPHLGKPKAQTQPKYIPPTSPTPSSPPTNNQEVSESFEERLEILANLLLDCASKTEVLLTEWRRMDVGRLYQFENAIKRLVKEK